MSIASLILKHRHMDYVLNKIDLSRISYNRLINSNACRIVLMEYENPVVSNSDVYTISFVPYTNTSVDDVLTPRLLNDLRDLIGIADSELYTRRKIVNGEYTSTCQLMLHIKDNMPPLIPLTELNYMKY